MSQKDVDTVVAWVDQGAKQWMDIGVENPGNHHLIVRRIAPNEGAEAGRCESKRQIDCRYRS